MIDERLSVALAALPQDAPPCATASALAAMLEVPEPDVHALAAAGEIAPSVLIAGIQVWAIEDLRVWSRRHEPLWDDSDADEPECWPREPAWDPNPPPDLDVRAHLDEWDTSFGFRRMSRAQLDELNRKYGPELRRLLGVSDV